MTYTATTAAAAIINATTTTEAQAIADQLRGTQLTDVARLLDVHLHGRAADKRQQLVAQSIGRLLTFATLQGDAGHGLVEAWRARKLAALR